MEIEINVNELKTELDNRENEGKPNFTCAEDEIIWYMHKHEVESKANRKNEDSIINYPIDEEKETFIDRLKKLWRLIVRIYYGEIYDEPEDTAWVTPYDSYNDRLFMGRITKKEWKAIKNKWNI